MLIAEVFSPVIRMPLGSDRPARALSRPDSCPNPPKESKTHDLYFLPMGPTYDLRSFKRGAALELDSERECDKILVFGPLARVSTS